eukprot:CAMPEP_0177650256 /NCGR_PEP_ID=MMETSP0447-20121125/11842_1 /TAXON_ID=0 /ORGANISM="Stygamoeba regulata, Strain BSH-02190019" /LENGTH=128 /DNA_ID=CAMNT_0019153107 /DNA_START=56 /DNA_END=442 /DNA_ORIENTATION=+
MPCVEHDPFFIQVDNFFKKAYVSGVGSVQLTFKQVTSERLQPGGGEGGFKAQQKREAAVQTATKGKGKSKAGPSTKSTGQYCMIRAVYKKQKVSTLVRGRDVIQFQKNLNQLMRGHMSSTMEKRSKRT